MKDRTDYFGIAVAITEDHMKTIRVDSAASHLRNALQILVLMTGTRHVLDVRSRIEAALALIEPAGRRCPCGEMTVNDCAGECGRPAMRPMGAPV